MTVTCGLIKGRHRLPDHVSTYVFSGDIPQANICDGDYLHRNCLHFFTGAGCPDHIEVYVTGFTPALLALVRVCSMYGVRLTAYNYDRESRSFWKQEVLL